MAVMVLNRFYQPIGWWSVHRAIVSLYLGKAQVVKADGDKAIHSVNRSFPIPTVIRLDKASYSRVVQQHFTRKLMFKRDNYTCQYCGCTNRETLTVDHINPSSRGGEDSWTNCVTACLKCNNKKGNKTPEEMGWKRPKAVQYMSFDMNEFWNNELSS